MASVMPVRIMITSVMPAERAKVPPIAQVPWSWVFIELVVHERKDWEAIVDPPHDPVLEDGGTGRHSHLETSAVGCRAQYSSAYPAAAPALRANPRWTPSFKAVLTDRFARMGKANGPVNFG